MGKEPHYLHADCEDCIEMNRFNKVKNLQQIKRKCSKIQYKNTPFCLKFWTEYSNGWSTNGWYYKNYGLWSDQACDLEQPAICELRCEEPEDTMNVCDKCKRTIASKEVKWSGIDTVTHGKVWYTVHNEPNDWHTQKIVCPELHYGSDGTTRAVTMGKVLNKHEDNLAKF